MTWETPLTAAIALYGAALSTAVFVTQRRDLRPKLRVALRHGNQVQEDGSSGSLGLFLEAMNVSHSDTTVWMAGASFSSTDHIQLQSTVTDLLPETIQPGRSFDFWINLQHLSEELKEREIHGPFRAQFFFEDEIHRIYRSPWCALDASRPEAAFLT